MRKTRRFWGHAFPGNFEKINALRLLLRPLWDGNRAIVAVAHMQSIASNFWLSIYALTKPVDIKFPQENSRTAGVVTDGEIVVKEHQAYTTAR